MTKRSAPVNPIAAVAARLSLLRERRHSDFTALIHEDRFWLDISVKRSWWPPVYSDQWFLPRLRITATNAKDAIERGELSCYIVEYPEDVSSVPTLKHGFQDVDHFSLSGLSAGDSQTFRLTIEPRFLRPKTYLLRMGIHRHVPVGSFAEELTQTLAQLEEPARSNGIRDGNSYNARGSARA